MIDKTYLTTNAKAAWFVLLASIGALTGCAADEGDDDTDVFGQPPTGTTDAGFVSDASAATTPSPEGGTVAPTPDAGMTVRPDAGTTSPTDSGSVSPADSGAMSDATTDGGSIAPDSGMPDSGMMMRPDQGMGDGKDVITIGDSWMNLSAGVGIENSLERVSKRDYRNFAVAGTKLLDEVIPNQYETALKAGPVKTVIMTGGGNDIIQDKVIFQLLSGPECSDQNFGAACKQQLDKIADRLAKLWAKMAQDGVQDVVIVGYTKTATPLGVAVSKSAEYSNEKIPPLCAAVPAPLRCHTFDTDMEVPNVQLRDGIHPDDMGYDAIGAAVWKLMQEKGMRR